LTGSRRCSPSRSCSPNRRRGPNRGSAGGRCRPGRCSGSTPKLLRGGQRTAAERFPACPRRRPGAPWRPLAELRIAARAAADTSRAKSTERAYGSDWRLGPFAVP
jgi:hypothetical protein